MMSAMIVKDFCHSFPPCKEGAFFFFRQFGHGFKKMKMSDIWDFLIEKENDFIFFVASRSNLSNRYKESIHSRIIDVLFGGINPGEEGSRGVHSREGQITKIFEGIPNPFLEI